MNSKLLGLLAMGLLAAPLGANAVTLPAEWNMSGTLTEASGADLPSGINVGDPFSFTLNFNSLTPVTNPVGCGSGGPGTRCNHNGDPLLQITNWFINGVNLGSFIEAGETGAIFKTIIVRNNALFGDLLVPVDGYSFGITVTYGKEGQIGDDQDNFVIVFRGPQNLDVVTDGRDLPLTPPVGLLDLESRLWSYCGGQLIENPEGSDLPPVNNCEYAFFAGQIESVPEPGTLALLGLGLAGLGLSRRRRAA